MQPAIQNAINHAAIFAECVQNPAENFHWGLFNDRGFDLKLPTTFERDAFASLLFGVKAGGGTNAFLLYPTARQYGADVDVFVSDGDLTIGNMEGMIREFHATFPQYSKPKACVFILFGTLDRQIREAYEQNGIPVAIIKPDTLTSSSLVSESIRTAIMGPLAIVNSIMEEPFLELPSWYYAI